MRNSINFDPAHSSNRLSVPRALNSYPASLQSAAEAIWGGNFWGRERINPERAQAPARPATGR